MKCPLLAARDQEGRCGVSLLFLPSVVALPSRREFVRVLDLVGTNVSAGHVAAAVRVAQRAVATALCEYRLNLPRSSRERFRPFSWSHAVCLPNRTTLHPNKYSL